MNDDTTVSINANSSELHSRISQLSDAQWSAALESLADGRDPGILGLPRFPATEIQTRTTGAAGSQTMAEAWQFYRDCLASYAKYAGRPLQDNDQVLDFGCGWGRISRPFLREVGLDGLFGIDVNSDLIDECRQAFNSVNFRSLGDPFPPTELPDDSFNLIVGYSVYSHLSEPACQAWMKEFARLTRPGGLIMLTTRGLGFLNYARNLGETAEKGTYPYFLSRMFDDFDEAIARYERGEFLHSNAEGITGGGVLTGKFYGESAIPEAYARVGFADSVDLVDWLPGGVDGRFHPVMVFAPKPAEC